MLKLNNLDITWANLFEWPSNGGKKRTLKRNFTTKNPWIKSKKNKKQANQFLVKMGSEQWERVRDCIIIQRGPNNWDLTNFSFFFIIPTPCEWKISAFRWHLGISYSVHNKGKHFFLLLNLNFRPLTTTRSLPTSSSDGNFDEGISRTH